MRSFLYPKLAVTNIQKNRKTYIPYILTGILTVAMYYIINSIVYNDGIKEMPGTDQVVAILQVGTGIVAIFSVIFLFYTNSFLMKQRKKELGLYNVLGMGKGHIAKMMLVETVIIAAVDILAGLICGTICSRLMFLLMLKITHINSPIKFHIESKAITITVILFIAIFGVMMLFNMWQVFKVNTIELLHSKNQGEREPKTKWFLALIGVVCVGAGYAIAITVEQPLQAITMFFVAVLLVIIGTYALFTAGSIALLKSMRKNKSYYYKTNHFISVSGMIYRMKQNAVGLANICILSTMVLVMLSTTVSLYVGMNNVLETRFPYEFNGDARNTSDDQLKEFRQLVRSEAKKRNLKIESETIYQGIDLTVISQGNNEFELMGIGPGYVGSIEKAAIITLVPSSWYDEITGKHTVLDDYSVLAVIPERNKSVTIEKGTLHLGDSDFDVKGKEKNVFDSGKAAMNALDTAYLVVSDNAFEELLSNPPEAVKDYIHTSGTIGYDVNGSEKEKEEFMTFLSDEFKKADFDGYVEVRELYRADFYNFYGGFLFLGIFLGSLFLMATVLIIYYKQISEGYDDKERFQIMQKVGMSKKEVRRSIKSQVVSVFLLPLIVAVIHICAAFKLITRLLSVFNLSDVALFRNCTIATIGVFALIYGIVYVITSREYYKIVN